jgi:hyaluronoglucosaminidase
MTIDGPQVDVSGVAIESDTAQDSLVWADLAELEPDALPAEGYALRIRERDGILRVMLAAADAAGERYGRLALKALTGGATAGVLPQLSVRDWPALPVRGVVEGFYGTPWTDADRAAFFDFAASNRLNRYVYAPKDEPLHRERWRELYDGPGLARLARLVEAAQKSGVHFTYAIHPATSMRYSDTADHDALVARAEQLWSIGVTSFALLFDDVPYELAPGDADRFDGAGSAHGDACARFVSNFLDGRPAEPLIMVPTDYAGNQRSEYRSQLVARLPESVAIWWTGSDVVVGEVTRADIDQAAAAFGRPLLLWDNYPVNDFDFSRLFLGPLQGRTTDLLDAPLMGITANPMPWATASRFGLASMAEWAWNPAAYSPAASAGRALSQLVEPAMATFVDAQSAWPPGAPQSERWSSLLGDNSSELKELCSALAATPIPVGRLGEELRPWIEAARFTAESILVAMDPTSGISQLRARRDRIAAAAANVLREPAIEYIERSMASRR